MDEEENVILFERFMQVLSDGEWHKIEDIADELSLSIGSLRDFLTSLEKAEVIQVEGNQYKGKNLVRGTDFVKRYFELPSEEDY